MEAGITIIPDVHGRSFWRDAVEAAPEGSPIVFLGDYLDPYPQEGIAPEESTRVLKEIIAFKKERLDNVTLLLGNHDLGYLDPDICFCRRDHLGAWENGKILEENLDLFDITRKLSFGRVKVLFSHAGIGVSWTERHRNLFRREDFDPGTLNTMLHEPALRPALYGILSEASPFRGGLDPTGSPVWADLDEYLSGEELLPGYFHLFGHTILEGGPVTVGNEGVCLDCRRAFVFTEDPLTLAPLP